jgi:hypothetical protein
VSELMLRSSRSTNNQTEDSSTSSHGRGSERVVRGMKRHPILYGILTVMVIEFLTGMATGFDLSVRLYYSLGVLLVVGWIWAKSSSEQMTADVKRSKGPHTVGDTISELVIIRSNGRMPKAWVEVEDRTDLPGVQF